MKSEKHPSKNMECKSTIRQNMMSVDDTNYLAKQSYHTKKDNIPVNSKQTDNDTIHQHMVNDLPASWQEYAQYKFEGGWL